jgi:hypothetical protein
MKLSEHFTLDDFLLSEVAARLGLDNTPTLVIIAHLSRMAAAMERIRTVLGNSPIVIRSGYRSPQVNKEVGGVATSAHCRGLACDFVCPGFGTPYEVALAILRSDTEYDQLILEYGWVHVGLAPEGVLCRQEVLTKRAPFTAYETGIKS